MGADMTVRVLWNDEFSVGHITLDHQHQQLLRQCNALADCIESTSPGADSRFHEILDELAVYARTHFETEEELLAGHGYEGLEAQRQEHFEYRRTVMKIICLAAVGEFHKIELQSFLACWWRDHILESDMAYREFLLGSARDERSFAIRSRGENA